MTPKVTAPKVKAMKADGKRIVCVTAYDAYFASLLDAAEIDVLLVGDSVGNVMLGYDSTVPVTLEEIVHHTRAVRRGLQRALLVADLPFGSYQSSVSQAVDSAVCLMKAGAGAVKLEGDYVEAIRAMVRAGIPVMGHLGMTPQSVNVFGGHRVQGRGEAGERVMEQARQLEEAGVFAIVLELVPAELAERISSGIGVPTIGIGAGVGCDGQVQVLHDLLGMTPHKFKHARRYADVHEPFIEALRRFASDVREGAFPTEEHSF